MQHNNITTGSPFVGPHHLTGAVFERCFNNRFCVLVCFANAPPSRHNCLPVAVLLHPIRYNLWIRHKQQSSTGPTEGSAPAAQNLQVRAATPRQRKYRSTTQTSTMPRRFCSGHGRTKFQQCKPTHPSRSGRQADGWTNRLRIVSPWSSLLAE